MTSRYFLSYFCVLCVLAAARLCRSSMDETKWLSASSSRWRTEDASVTSWRSYGT